jgi:UBX domain-containing protein 1/4
VADAIDWLDKNADKSIDDLKAEDAATAEDGAPADPTLQPGETAKSLICNDCGKKFRSQAQAEFHASKTEHENFSESTEEIAPLTEEEKKQRLADLKEKLAAKRAGLSEQEKLDKKRNEEINRKKTKESQDIKEQLKVKESLKEAENKKREKRADIEAKKRIQAKIAADKEERRLKNEREKAARAGQSLPQVAAVVPEPTPAATSKPASAYTETRLRL